MSKFFGIILVLLLLAAIGGGVYVWWTYSQKITDQEKEIEDLKKEIEGLKETDTDATSESDLEFSEVYQSSDFGYKVQYHENWSASQSDKSENTETVKFLDAEKKEVVRVSVQLRDLEGILKESFEIQKTTSATIGQVEGEKLEVVDNKSGETEIYYLVKKGNYLYTLSAAKNDANFLNEMVETFSFSI